MIEHTLAGLEGEASPLLGSRAACGPGKGGPVLVHLSRGIHRLIPERLNPPSQYPNLAPGTNILHLYDAFFVFEEKAVVDVNREFWGADPFVENKIHYLGRVAARNADELGSPVEFPAGFRTKDRPFVLLSLGRFGNIEDLHFNLFKILRKVCRHRDVELRVVADVYLKPEILKSLKNHGDSQGVRFLPFIPYLVQVMSRADLVICRAGYNMINEVLLSGVKALIIPENHPSREQERRAAGLSGKGLLVRDEDYCLSEKIEEDLKWLMKEPPRPPFGDYDRFRIGRIMIEELQRLLPSKQVRCS
jgi:predicted glycosyltransferase